MLKKWKSTNILRKTAGRHWNFPISIGDMVKDQFGLFLFLKRRQYVSTGAEEENCLRC